MFTIQENESCLICVYQTRIISYKKWFYLYHARFVFQIALFCQFQDLVGISSIAADHDHYFSEILALNSPSDLHGTKQD